MAVDWTLYEKILGIEGSPADARATAIDGAVNIFIDGIVNDPAYQENALVAGKLTPIVASRTSTTKCSIKAIPNTDIHIGDMVKCFGEDWIIVELHTDKIGIISGEMWLCNNTIKFQNQSSIINTRLCVVDDGTYSKKSSDPDAFVMTNTYKLYITIDSATERIFVDKRIGFGDIYSPAGDKILEVYKVIGIDLKSKNYGKDSHLMVLTMQRDVYNPETDSISDNICDIFKEGASTTSPTTTGECYISGKDFARIGTTRKYTVMYTDVNGNKMDGIEPIWDIIAPAGITYAETSNDCVINIPLDGNLVGEIVCIRVSDKDGMYGSFEKKVQVITVG